ncbi:hypothetical protein CPB84DRAFT_1746489 [Gymnopilus junonius]|uniref:Uncharacterized protein n=1 Tax=Gymnopilus junonius TaxID=109634 RepID=A0A9P5NSY9_GYMJU|nr:hypothetical protein CPB84DRAFT_1746489 [Gymnopilus junonius]
MCIRDVGMIDPHGQFVFGFNIFSSAANPLHEGQVLDEFEGIQPALDIASEVQAILDYFKPGTIIASKGVNINQISEEPLKVSMWSTACEGALLVLPHGGFHEDLASTSQLTKYVNRHALNWYQYMCQHSRSSVATVLNGSVFLISGCDRAKSWVTCFRKCFMRDSDVTFHRHQKILLKQHPAADIILVEDSVWHHLDTDGHSTLPEILKLVIAAIMTFQLVTTDNLVSLIPKTSPAPPSQKFGLIKDLLAKYIDW